MKVVEVRFRLLAVATAACGVLVLGLLASGIAAGREHAPRHRGPVGYRTHGHSSYYARNEQVCFEVSWSGSGDWATTYDETTAGANNEPGSISDADAWSFSWRVHTAPGAGASCPFEVLAGKLATGAGPFDAGSVTTRLDQHDVSMQPLQPTVSTVCNRSHRVSVSITVPYGGTFSVTARRSELVFNAGDGIGPSPCSSADEGTDNPGDSSPGTAVTGGRVADGDWNSSESARVPVSVFERAKSVAIPISDHSSRGGPLRNCGVESSSVTCSQHGAWQGTLVLTQVS